MQVTRRFAFGQDIELLRMVRPEEGAVCGIATDEWQERVICYTGSEVDMARAYMKRDKEATVYTLSEIGWVLVEQE